MNKGSEDSTLLFDTSHTEALIRQQSEGGAIFIKAVLDTGGQTREHFPILNLTSTVDRLYLNSTETQFYIKLLSMTATSATVSISVASTNDKTSQVRVYQCI